MAYQLVLLLHILSMAAWLGSALWLPGDVKRTLAAGGDAAALRARVRPALALDAIAGVATVATGLGLAALHPPVRIGLWIGAAFGIGLLGLVLGGVRPAWGRVAARLEAGDAAGARQAARPLAALSGVAHLLWLAAVSLMVLPV
jgi:uncharacterized membrane protein